MDVFEIVTKLQETPLASDSSKRISGLLHRKHKKYQTQRIFDSFLKDMFWVPLFQKRASEGVDHVIFEVQLERGDAQLLADYFEFLGFMSFISRQNSERESCTIVIDWKKRHYVDD